MCVAVAIMATVPLTSSATGAERRDYLARFTLPSRLTSTGRAGTPTDVKTWLTAGGRARIAALAGALKAAYGPGVAGDVAGVRTGSAQLASVVIAARSFPPIPDAMAQESWAASLQFAAEAVAYYRAFLQDPSTGFVDPLAHISVFESVTALTGVDRRITAVTR